jgi:hypothetical protein
MTINAQPPETLALQDKIYIRAQEDAIKVILYG